VIIAPYESAVKLAIAATQTVPIVMIAIDYDPLALGYIKSLARPGHPSGMSKKFCSADVPRITRHMRLPASAMPRSTRTLGHWLGDSAAPAD
jgi:hypothetical protein